MPQEEFVYQPGKVGLILADSDERICRLAALYAQDHSSVELCAAVGSARDLLELVQRGLRPQVLVLDSLLSDLRPAWFVQQLARMEYHPQIIVTGTENLRRWNESFLEIGIQSFVVKPYGMEELFAEVYRQGANPAMWAGYCVRERYRELMYSMKCSRRLSGWKYLERILLRTTLDPENLIAKELYLYVAEEQRTTVRAVTAALQRVSASLCEGKTDAYAILCRSAGKPVGSRLSNLELISVLTEELTRTIPLPARTVKKEKDR